MYTQVDIFSGYFFRRYFFYIIFFLAYRRRVLLLYLRLLYYLYTYDDYYYYTQLPYLLPAAFESFVKYNIVSCFLANRRIVYIIICALCVKTAKHKIHQTFFECARTHTHTRPIGQQYLHNDDVFVVHINVAVHQTKWYLLGAEGHRIARCRRLAPGHDDAFTENPFSSDKPVCVRINLVRIFPDQTW